MNIRYIITQHKAKRRITLIPVFWLLGLCLGISMAFLSSEHSTDILHACMMQSTSPFLALLVAILPMTIVVTAIKRSMFWVAYPLILLNGMWRGYCGMLIFISFHRGAWLLMSLFLFSAGIESVLLWFLLIRHYVAARQTFKQDLQLVTVVYLATFAINQFLISPFLSDLIKYI